MALDRATANINVIFVVVSPNYSGNGQQKMMHPNWVHFCFCFSPNLHISLRNWASVFPTLPELTKMLATARSKGKFIFGIPSNHGMNVLVAMLGLNQGQL